MDARTGPRWSKGEDERLEHLVAIYGSNNAWDTIASMMYTSDSKHHRSPPMCFNRWAQVIKLGVTKGPWTEEEDNIIKACIQQVDTEMTLLKHPITYSFAIKGYTKWSEVAKRIPGHRLGKQVSEFAVRGGSCA